MKKSWLLIVLMSCASMAQTGPGTIKASPPRAYPGGDYWVRNENTWMDWEVACPQLVGRLTPDWPADEEVAGATLGVDWAVARWPEVARFSKGQKLRVKPDSTGGFLIKDLDGNSWMKVDLGDGHLCFVRANARFVKPARPTEAVSQSLGAAPGETPAPAAAETPAP